MAWTTLMIPLAMATVGVGAAGASLVMPDRVPAQPSATWIDSPEPTSDLHVGKVPVAAHATDRSDISGLDLFVDGKRVAGDTSLRRINQLVYAQFQWDAPVGPHVLVVRQVGGDETASRAVTVVIGSPKTDDPSTPTTTPDTTTTTESTTSTTATTEVPPVTVPDGPLDTTPPPAPPPVTAPPVTNPSASVFIDAADITSPYRLLYLSGCGYTVEVTAQIRGADYASAIIRGTGVEVDMTQSGTTWTAQIVGGAPLTDADLGARQVTVVAGSGDEVIDRVVGTVTIADRCPKD